MLQWLAQHVGGPSLVIFTGVVLTAIGGLWAAQQNARLSSQLAGSITGGDSYCYLRTTKFSEDTGEAALMLDHDGEYPVYDVSVRLVDLKKLAAIEGQRLTLRNLTEADTYFNVGNVAPGQSRILGYLVLKGTEPQGYNVFISARNGMVTQALRFRYDGESWLRSLEVSRGYGEDHEVLLRETDEGFDGLSKDDG